MLHERQHVSWKVYWGQWDEMSSNLKCTVQEEEKHSFQKGIIVSVSSSRFTCSTGKATQMSAAICERVLFYCGNKKARWRKKWRGSKNKGRINGLRMTNTWTLTSVSDVSVAFMCCGRVQRKRARKMTGDLQREQKKTNEWNDIHKKEREERDEKLNQWVL